MWWWAQSVRCCSQACWSFLSGFAMPKRWRWQPHTEPICIVVSSSLWSLALVLCSEWLGELAWKECGSLWERIKMTQSQLQEVGGGKGESGIWVIARPWPTFAFYWNISPVFETRKIVPGRWMTQTGKWHLLPSLRPELDPWTHMVVAATQFIALVFWPAHAHQGT